MATAAEEGEKGLGKPAPPSKEEHKANPQAPSLQALVSRARSLKSRPNPPGQNINNVNLNLHWADDAGPNNDAIQFF